MDYILGLTSNYSSSEFQTFALMLSFHSFKVWHFICNSMYILIVSFYKHQGKKLLAKKYPIFQKMFVVKIIFLSIDLSLLLAWNIVVPACVYPFLYSVLLCDVWFGKLHWSGVSLPHRWGVAAPDHKNPASLIRLILTGGRIDNMTQC